jgi:probable HAF family extracellular repeat protein
MRVDRLRLGRFLRVLILGAGLSCYASSTIAHNNPIAPGASTAPRYSVVDLGPFFAREIDERPTLNRAGHLASWQIINENHAQAVLIIDGRGVPIAGMPSARNSYAFGINEADHLVGIIQSPDDMRDTQAFSFDHGKFVFLPTLGGPQAAAHSINNRDVIVGNAQTLTHTVHAVSWSAGRIEDLGTLPGGDFSRAFQINDSGEVAGEANVTHNGKSHAVLWWKGRIRDLGLLPGGTFSSAQAVNAHHVAVGFADTDDGDGTAVRFASGHALNLGSLGDEPSAALGINDAGQIVGIAAVAEGQMRAFLWEKGVMRNLNESIPKEAQWLLLTAYHINAQGEILAYGFHNGRSHACVLVPLNEK